MDKTDIIISRRQKLNELKVFLSEVDNKLLSLTKELNWDYNKLLEEKTSNMVVCTINPQHRVPISNIKVHEHKCSLHHQGYSDNEKFFPEHSGSGSFITFTPETLQLVTKNVHSPTVFLNEFVMMELKSNHILLPTSIRNIMVPDYDKIVLKQVKKILKDKVRAVPLTSANYDQNFKSSEKLAIYDYVIANTQKQKSYPDLWLEPAEKPEEKREMAAWEIAAAERDAKRRRASYRNKVHTNRKTHTEILREVIAAQMEAFKGETTNEKTHKKQTTKYEKDDRHQTLDYKKSSHESKETSDRHQSRCHQTSSWGNEDGRDKRHNYSREKHSKHRDHKRFPPDTGSDIKSRSRSHDKYRKWKTYEGRSHSHRSSHTHARKYKTE